MTKENKLKNESIDLVTEFIKTSIVYYCYDSLPYLNDDSAPAVLTIPSLQKTGDDEYLDCTEAETYAELILHNLESNINYLIFEEITHYFKDILDEQDRQAAAISAPAHGLFLWKVNY